MNRINQMNQIQRAIFARALYQRMTLKHNAVTAVNGYCVTKEAK